MQPELANRHDGSVSVHEMIPIVGGLLLGLLTHRRGRPGAYTVVAVLVMGIGSAYVNGELGESWGFALVDVMSVTASYVAAGWLARRVRRAMSGRSAPAR